jgi:hypothetical protein
MRGAKTEGFVLTGEFVEAESGGAPMRSTARPQLAAALATDPAAERLPPASRTSRNETAAAPIGAPCEIATSVVGAMLPMQADWGAAAAPPISDVNLFRDRQCIVNFDAEVTNGAFDLRVTEQQLDRPEVAGPTVDQSRFRAA